MTFRDGLHTRAQHATGDCLRPWVLDGEVVLWDRTVTPCHGDLVVTRDAFTLRAGLGGRARPMELYGAKQLKIDARGRRWLCCADGAYLADPEHTIVGVVRAVARRPWRRAPPMTELNFPIRPV